MRRSIKDRLDAVKNETKRHVENGDKDFLIAKTTFKIDYTMSENDIYVIAKDGVDYDSICRKSIPAMNYRRRPFITTGIELFDAIIGLPKKSLILLGYIIKELKNGGNKIILEPKKVSEVIDEKYYTNTNKYINKLVEAKLIDKAPDSLERHLYVINHNTFFKGSFNKFIDSYNRIYGESEHR